MQSQARSIEIDSTIPRRQNSCGILGVSNAYYFLASDLEANGTCFTVNASNVTLDCMGYTVNYSRSQSGYALVDEGNPRVSVRNCVFQQATNFSDSYGVLLREVDNATVVNNSIVTTSSNSIGILCSLSSGATVANNSVYASGIDGIGILINFSDSNEVNSNIFSVEGSTAAGVLLNFSDSNRIEENTISSDNASALNVSFSSSNMFIGNTIYLSGSSGSVVELS